MNKNYSKYQQKIIKKLLNFWQTDVGIDYNTHRHEALKNVMIVSSIEQALEHIENEEHKTPLLLATSAQRSSKAPLISYKDQSLVWTLERPVVIIFGTARGLAPALIEQCDFLLVPVEGFSDFNHLSVRSAAAIVFDRWLGLQPTLT